MVGAYTGVKWGASAATGTPGGVVTWSFNLAGAELFSFDGAITSTPFQAAVRAAFDVWETLANIDFQEVGSPSARIQLGWDMFDGAGGTLGQAYWQYQGTKTIQAEVAFDRAEDWSPTPGSGQSFFAVAVHEIGHTIGLAHTEDPTSIMYPYLGTQTLPNSADIAAIAALYGPASTGQALAGGMSDDALTGATGNDTLSGGFGSDRLMGNEGADLLYGNEGADILFGNQGNDALYGGQDGDEIYGGQNDDLLFGNLGNDELYGNLGQDGLHGGQGDDALSGGEESDTLNGGLGNDSLEGGAGVDVFVFASGGGNDVVGDFRASEGDRLDVGGRIYGASQVNGSTVLTFADGGSATLLGVTDASYQDALVT